MLYKACCNAKCRHQERYRNANTSTSTTNSASVWDEFNVAQVHLRYPKRISWSKTRTSLLPPIAPHNTPLLQDFPNTRGSVSGTFPHSNNAGRGGEKMTPLREKDV